MTDRVADGVLSNLFGVFQVSLGVLIALSIAAALVFFYIRDQ